jgi:hypothetical protein
MTPQPRVCLARTSNLSDTACHQRKTSRERATLADAVPWPSHSAGSLTSGVTLLVAPRRRAPEE